MKEIGVVSWKLPPHEMSCQHFREIFPQRKLPRLEYMKKPVCDIINWANSSKTGLTVYMKLWSKKINAFIFYAALLNIQRVA